MSNVQLLFVSLFIYGAGSAYNLQARYAGTDLAKPSQRAKAISIILMSTTFGAFAGPNLVDVMGRFCGVYRCSSSCGNIHSAAAAFTLAGLVLLAFLRPDDPSGQSHCAGTACESTVWCGRGAATGQQ